MSQYTDNDVTVLRVDRDRVRQTPHVYTRNKKLGGIIHLFVEAFDNSMDEHVLNGTDIFVRFVAKTKEMTVSDNGRGIPHGKMQDMLEVLNSSGKYGNKKKQSAYKTSTGQNGMGMKIINFLSDYMTVTSKRDGIKKTIKYVDGLHSETIEEKCKKSEHGTTITFRPSKEWLHAKSIDKLSEKHLLDVVERKMYVAGPDLRVIFVTEKENGKETTKEMSGYSLEKYIKKLSGGRVDKIYRLALPANPDPEENFRGGDFVFQFDSENTEEKLEGYANTLFTKDGGTHVKGAREAVCDYLRKETTKRLSQVEAKSIQIRSEDVKAALVGVVSVFLIEPEFKGQTKDELESSITKELTKVITDAMKTAFSDKDLVRITNIIKTNAKARIQSTKIIKKIKKSDSISKFSKDAIDNYTRISPKSSSNFKEVFLVEGLSAAGAMKLARDPDSQAIYAIKGKPTNFFRKSKVQIMQHPMIKDLSQIYGIEPFTDDVPEDLDRAVIATDADIDGDAMAASLMVLHYIAFPGVIASGKLHKAVFPLYKIEKGKTPLYLLNNAELSKYISKEFLKKHRLFFKGNKFTRSRTIDFIERNIRYTEIVDRVSKKHAASKNVIELACLCLNLYGDKQFAKWKADFKKHFKDIKIEDTKEGIELNGIDMDTKSFTTLVINKDFKKDVKDICSILKMNYDEVYGYQYEEKGKKISLYKILKKISKSIGNGQKTRFKGLGEMEPEDLYETTLNRKNRKSLRVTIDDVDEARMSIEMLHGGSSASKKKFFIDLLRSFDISDIDT